MQVSKAEIEILITELRFRRVFLWSLPAASPAILNSDQKVLVYSKEGNPLKLNGPCKDSRVESKQAFVNKDFRGVQH